MDNGSQHSLTLVRLSQGGYIVQDAYISGSGMLTQHHFATDDIDDALKFMREKIFPIPATSCAGDGA